MMLSSLLLQLVRSSPMKRPEGIGFRDARTKRLKSLMNRNVFLKITLSVPYDGLLASLSHSKRLEPVPFASPQCKTGACSLHQPPA